MASVCLCSLVSRSIRLGIAIVFCSAAPLLTQQPNQTPGATTSSPGDQPVQPSPLTAPASKPSALTDHLPESVFLLLDKNHDKVLNDTEVNASEAAPWAAKLKQADRDSNGRITLEEFNRLGELPIYRDPRTAGAILLILGFASFCMFLDGLFDPDHRDYFSLSIAGLALCTGLAYFIARPWYVESVPYLAYIAAVPALLIVGAILFGATKEKEEPVAAETGPVVYQVGKKPGETSAGAGKTGQAARKPAPPVRTPRPAPLPRPPVPERRPQATPKPPPPRPAPTPPRPPGSRPPGGPKPPPGKP